MPIKLKKLKKNFPLGSIVLTYANPYALLKNKSLKHIVSKKLLQGLGLAAITLVLTACNYQEHKTSQVLARVNGKEITVYQLNQELKHFEGHADAKTRQHILQTLIDRELLVDQALNNKLDRNPNVMEAIERSKASILVQAYLEGQTAHLPKPSQTEISDFFQKHQELFTKRKIFNTHELIIDAKDVTPELSNVLNAAQSTNDVTTWLEQHNIRYAPRQMSRATTDLPLDMATQWQNMKPGDKIIMNENGYKILAILENITDAPLSFEVAKPQIEQYLSNLNTQETQKSVLSKLRSTAKIEYLNPAYSDPSTETPTESENSTPKGDHMEQGIKGLR